MLRGEAIGVMGCTGNCTGPHLHYAIYVVNGNSSYPVNPLTYIEI